MGLEDTIKEYNQASNKDRAKILILIRHDLNESLRNEYLTIKEPVVLWINLKERYDHLKLVVFSKARYNCIHLRLQDFKSISEYNSAMFRITSQLKLDRENIIDYDMLRKTFSTCMPRICSYSSNIERKILRNNFLLTCC